MERKVDKNQNEIVNIDGFSKAIGRKLEIAEDGLKNYLFSNISVGLVKTQEMILEIEEIYSQNKLFYYNTMQKSSAINHIIMTEGPLEQITYARKVLGILLCAEEDFNLRNKIIKLLKKFYPIVFKAVRRHSLKELKEKYSQMDLVTRETESRIDAAVYFYVSIYKYPDNIDQNCVISIINEFQDFQFNAPITTDILDELNKNRAQIENVKSLIMERYGNIFNYKNIINHKNKVIEEFGNVVENLFMINKLNINHLFKSLCERDIEEIILANIKQSRKMKEPGDMISNVICCVFIKSLINQYKNSKDLYFQNNKETLLYKINDLEGKFNSVEKENLALKGELNSLKGEKIAFNERLNYEVNKISKSHKLKISEMQNKIMELEKSLLEERKYRDELNALREYVFEVNNEYIPKQAEKTLEDYIDCLRVLIIGGTKEWRRKFRGKYPDLRTLSGFNENFDVSILGNYEYIFFYSGYMNHATYYRTMNFIRANGMKFGYIGKTNMELVEFEIMDEIKKFGNR